MDDDTRMVVTHARFRRMDVRDPRRHIVVVLDNDGIEKRIEGAPGFVWMKARDELEALDGVPDRRPRMVRGTKRS